MTDHKTMAQPDGAAVAAEILDSRAFSELSQYGRWTISPEEYLAFVARCDEEIGGLQWCGPQDWMCEDEVIHGGMLGRVPCVGTGLSVQAHQELTVQSYLDLTRLWPQFSTRPCPVIPVLQSDTPAGYLRCYQMYLDAGADLGEECQLIGVGSVCRQQRTGQIAATARLLGELGVDLHYFGVKLTGLTRPELQRDLRRPFSGGVASLDSESWSLEARYGKRRPDCTHLGRDGQPNKCNNCPAYAAWWAGGVTQRGERRPVGGVAPAAADRPVLRVRPAGGRALNSRRPSLASPTASRPRASRQPEADRARQDPPGPMTPGGSSLVTYQLPPAAASSHPS